MKQEILRFENVTCKKDGAVYLDNFSFYMTAGEIVGLLSVNDRGIKELIELTAKNHPIDAGRVYMGGKLVNSYLPEYSIAMLSELFDLLQKFPYQTAEVDGVKVRY